LLTPGDNTTTQITSHTAFRLGFSLSSVMARRLLRDVHSRETQRRETAVDKAAQKSHEGNNHKRACIAGSNRNHRTCARAWRCPGGKRDGRVW
jgi:hypothetical protein